MRLNDSSMNKLFDLITMGLKYQVCMYACEKLSTSFQQGKGSQQFVTREVMSILRHRSHLHPFLALLWLRNYY